MPLSVIDQIMDSDDTRMLLGTYDSFLRAMATPALLDDDSLLVLRNKIEREATNPGNAPVDRAVLKAYAEFLAVEAADRSLPVAADLAKPPAAPLEPWGDHAQAVKEGWDIFETTSEGTGPFQLQRIDCPENEDGTMPEPIFAEDDDAWAFVVKQADAGSKYHQAALHWLEKHSRGEWELIADKHNLNSHDAE